MTVQAQDAGKPMLSSTVTVYVNVIDENDNAPVFETNSYNVDVHENATVNAAVASAMATDRDSGKTKHNNPTPYKFVAKRVHRVRGGRYASSNVTQNVDSPIVDSSAARRYFTRSVPGV